MTSNLYIGQIRTVARPSRIATPPECELRFGVEVLRDPGIENQPGGPGGNEIPENDLNADVTVGLGWPSEDPTFSTVPPISIGWHQTDVTDHSPWVLATANPQAGTDHARIPSEVTGTPSTPSSIVPIGVDLNLCYGTTGAGRWATARAQINDTVTPTLYIADHTGLTGSYLLECQMLDTNGTSINSTTRSLTAPASTTDGVYVQWAPSPITVLDGLISGTTEAIRLILSTNVEDSTARNIDVDSWSVQITDG